MIVSISHATVPEASVAIRMTSSARAMAVGDSTPKNAKILIKGMPQNPGPEVPRQFIEVLAHEMVHQYQVEVQNRIDHGKTFWAWREKFSKYNIRLRLQG